MSRLDWGGPMELDNRALPLTRRQLDLWLAQDTGQLRYGVVRNHRMRRTG